MPSLQIRKLPISIYRALKQAAAEQHHSLSQQAIIALAKGLKVPIDYRARRKLLIDQIRTEQQQWTEIAGLDVASWLREDRDR
jgi:plasmid stability protein